MEHQKKGEYVGHWMNVKEIHGEKYYIDMTYQRIFKSKEEVSMFWGILLPKMDTIDRMRYLI